MEYGLTDPVGRELTFVRDDEEVSRSLDHYLAANAETARRKALYPTERDALIAETMRHPMSPESAFAYFGALLGSVPPLTIFLSFIFSGPDRTAPLALALMTATTIVATAAGYSFGKVIAVLVQKVENRSLSQRLILSVLIGMLWGAVSGAAGGVFIFIIGAFFGGMIGAAVGAAAVPMFVFPYQTVKYGGKIDRRHFLPLSIGVTAVISAAILGTFFG